MQLGSAKRTVAVRRARPAEAISNALDIMSLLRVRFLNFSRSEL
jgi:hypothetical protein